MTQIRRGPFRQIGGTLLLSGVLLLAACGGDDAEELTAPDEAASPAGSPALTGSPDASPGITGSPDASPEAAAPVDVATAFENLLAQPSFVMEIDLEGLPVIAQAVPLVDDTVSMRLEKAGDDRYLTVMDPSGATLLELWVVDDEIYFDIGQGAAPLPDTAALGVPEEAIVQLLDAPEELIAALASDNADWEVTGEAEVNGFNTIVEEASYEVSGIGDTIYFNAGNATIDAMLWVEQDERFLVQMNADIIQGGAASEDGTPEAGTPTDGTPTTETASQITIDVLSVGDVEQIEVPTTE